MSIISDSIEQNAATELQYKESISYFKNQLSLVAKELKQARKLDKDLYFKHTDKVKELLNVIKEHRSLNDQALNELYKKTNSPVEIQQFYLVEVEKKIANTKAKLFTELKELVANKVK